MLNVLSNSQHSRSRRWSQDMHKKDGNNENKWIKFLKSLGNTFWFLKKVFFLMRQKYIFSNILLLILYIYEFFFFCQKATSLIQFPSLILIKFGWLWEWQLDFFNSTGFQEHFSKKGEKVSDDIRYVISHKK